MKQGLIYNLTLPWSELLPFVPEIGYRIGVYLVLKNNNGTGLVDSLQWPKPLSGMWQTPNRWGVLNLVE